LVHKIFASSPLTAERRWSACSRCGSGRAWWSACYPQWTAWSPRRAGHRRLPGVPKKL